MSKEKRYLQWGYESYRDTETGEVRTDYVDLLNTQADKIAYLEAKQAESEEKIDKLETQSIIDIDHISYYQSQYLEIKDQLAEKDKAIENWETMYQSVMQTCHNDKEEIERLNKQLADTEAQNKRVLEKLDLIVRSNQELEKENELMAKTLKMTKFVEKEVNQDKISFALEQLEKVKELLFEKAIEITGASVDGVRLYSINEIFSNQIKQLKEME